MIKVNKNSNNARAVRLGSRRRKAESRRSVKIQNNKLTVLPGTSLRTSRPRQTHKVSTVPVKDPIRTLSNDTFTVESYRNHDGSIDVVIFNSSDELLCQMPEENFKGFMDGFFKKAAKTA